MCPLRYIVLFVSALVALVIMVWGVKDSSDEKLEKLLDDEDENDHVADQSESKPVRQTRAVDFITGRYLYDKYQLYQKRKDLQNAGHQDIKG